MAMQIVDGMMPAREDEQLAAWQVLVDAGMVWTLPGRYGRTAQDLIDRGLVDAPQHVNA